MHFVHSSRAEGIRYTGSPRLRLGASVHAQNRELPILRSHYGSPQPVFTDKASVTALEVITDKLKKGMWSAVNHFFAQEFPHDIREAILSSVDEGLTSNGTRLTESQTAQGLKDYMHAICGSTSKLAAYIDSRHWGTEVTLRMMTKVLEREIFVVVAPQGPATRSFCRRWSASSRRPLHRLRRETTISGNHRTGSRHYRRRI